MILTSKLYAKLPFAGQNTQHPELVDRTGRLVDVGLVDVKGGIWNTSIKQKRISGKEKTAKL